ncbi:MAG: acetyl-CoA carboxylase biotin carboxyl carrier protein [Arenicella sp.]
MDLRKIKKLIELLEESNLQEMEIQEGEESIRLSRSGGVAAPVAMPQMQMPAAPTAVVAPAPAAETESNGPDLENALTSPMVGTFYISPKPGDPAFVKVGDTVAAGDVLCIVEAMKIFNQIEADRAGKIVAIMKESGDPVEYGEPLFIIE